MKFSPYSLHHAPVTLPVWQAILDDLGRPHPSHVARVLGVGVRTVHRWNRDQRAPRTACLALFWLTRWGRSAVEAQAVNDCRVAVGYANALESELARLRARLVQVLAIGEFGSANDPASIEGVRHVGIR
jgi:hypothetical protein